MKSVTRHVIRLLLMFVVIVCSFPALAAYAYATVDYPGAISTTLWGINNSGEIVGDAVFDAIPAVSFLYDPRKRAFTALPRVPGEVESATVSNGLIGINDPGVVVGATSFDGVTQSGVILGTNDAFTFFSHPGWPITIGRAVGNSGLVTGYATNLDNSDYIGFIYNPIHSTFIDFLDSPQTIAQGINAHGQVVGSVFFLPNGVYPGSPSGPYGFLRDTSGTITLFRVNSSRTRGRGLSDSGRIAGYVATPSGNQAFVASLSGPLGGFQALNIPASELLDAPGAVNTYAQAIDNGGQVVGYWDDGNPNQFSHGFIATLIATDKDQCKDGGWESLSRADGTLFKNQGDCIQYVNTGK
jgi:uncharacterized membrane protein